MNNIYIKGLGIYVGAFDEEIKNIIIKCMRNNDTTI